MNTSPTSGSGSEAQRYYDARYADNYADGWSQDRYARIRSLVASLPLPQRGVALDFGCGRGALTRTLAQALPGWTVEGADLSEVALADAARRAPDLRFLHISTLGHQLGRYDFVFSHHVLEHVPDLGESLGMLASLARPEASMLHVLPCGNPGSFEHRLAALRKDGIDVNREGRFFCDDEPHVRRATSDQIRTLMESRGFWLENQWFADHNWGARNSYAMKDVRAILQLTDPRRAVSVPAAIALAGHRVVLLATALACLPTYYRWRVAQAHRDGGGWTARQVAGVACALPLSAFSMPVRRALAALSAREWRTRAFHPAGQEMYLYFHRRRADCA